MDADSLDCRLVDRVQSGEHDAFDVLVNRYRRRILKLSMRYTRNAADAEDVVQETFIKAFRALGRYRGEAAFSSWLHRIAVNSAKTAIALRNRNSRKFSANSDEKPDPAFTRRDLATPEALALTEEIRAAVNTAIDTLPVEQREAIVLRELQGLSYSQVALEMACPIGTVRSRVSRARDLIDRRLRRVFDDGLGRREASSNASRPESPPRGCARPAAAEYPC